MQSNLVPVYELGMHWQVVDGFGHNIWHKLHGSDTWTHIHKT